MANILEKIVADKRTELQLRKKTKPLDSFIQKVVPTERDFYSALAKPGTNFILECKKASPSKVDLQIGQPFHSVEDILCPSN